MATTAITRPNLAINIAKAAAAALITMGLGAFGLYIIIGWAKVGFGGKAGPFAVGPIVPALVAIGLGVLKRATSSKTTDSEGFTLGTLVLIGAIVLTIILMVWAVSTGWVWTQFWYGMFVLVLGLWAAATTVHLTHKFYTN